MPGVICNFDTFIISSAAIAAAVAVFFGPQYRRKYSHTPKISCTEKVFKRSKGRINLSDDLLTRNKSVKIIV